MFDNGFYWKFTRSGRHNTRYAVNSDRRIWHTSFEEIEICLVLLHDVETCNVPSLGPTKPAFRDIVRSIGYEPSSLYKETRQEMYLVKGKDVMGRHDGVPLDWGCCNDRHTPIDVDITEGRCSSHPVGAFKAWQGKAQVKAGRSVSR